MLGVTKCMMDDMEVVPIISVGTRMMMIVMLGALIKMQVKVVKYGINILRVTKWGCGDMGRGVIMVVIVRGRTCSKSDCTSRWLNIVSMNKRGLPNGDGAIWGWGWGWGWAVSL